MAARASELQKLLNRQSDVNAYLAPELKTCAAEFQKFFQKWSTTNSPSPPPDGNAFHWVDVGRFIPDGNEIRAAMIKTLSNPDLATSDRIGLQLRVANCVGELFFVMTRDQYKEMENALIDQDFPFDRKVINQLLDELSKNTERIEFSQMVIGKIRADQVEAEARGSATGAESTDSVVVWQRLIQTSITRFGILAVIGFFVSLLVSLYRYNVRLAAYYRARADGLLFLRDGVISGGRTVRNFEILERILTPQLDFGRTPPTPVSQIIDLIRATRGVDKAED